MRNAWTDSREARPLGLHINLRPKGNTSSKVELGPDVRRAASALEVVGHEAEAKRILGLVDAVKSLWGTAPSDPATGSIFCDALEFAGSLPPGVLLPRVWFDEGEVGFEWIEHGRHAVVSIEGDGVLGYAYRVDGTFEPGAIAAAEPHSFPADLLAYLTAG